MKDTLLATLPLDDKEVTYTIYLYIDSTVSLGNYNDKTYSGYIYTTTEQTSTIGKSEDNTNKNLGLQTIDFDYLGSEQQFIVPQTGTYQLETWGAQGGSDNESYHGGYGAYSIGNVSFKNGEHNYVYVGGKGKVLNKSKDNGTEYGFPNGGAIKVICCDTTNSITFSSGGGSTHITTLNQELRRLSTNEILIVSGGGGGVSTWWNVLSDGGSGGGFIGNSTKINFDDVNPTGGTQSSGGKGGGNLDGQSASSWLNGIFGMGGGVKVSNTINISGAGGGGYYGGGASWGGSGAGGSGYIGNSKLTNKAMYCYNCEESTEESTKTISTTNVSETPISKYAKKGNGYARITIIN